MADLYGAVEFCNTERTGLLYVDKKGGIVVLRQLVDLKRKEERKYSALRLTSRSWLSMPRFREQMPKGELCGSFLPIDFCRDEANCF